MDQDKITVTPMTSIEPGRYRVLGGCDWMDSELPAGCIEVYVHPIRGLSFWDDGHDDSTDFSGHVPCSALLGETIIPLLTHP